MPDRYLYLAVDTLCLLFPLLCSFHRRIPFYTQWRYFVLPCFSTAVLFIGWDIAFTAIGVWSFNHRYVLGIYLFGLPAEEYLFFLAIPYACVFTYYSISVLLSIKEHALTVRWATLLFAIVLIATGCVFLPRLYTSVTFIFLAVILYFLVHKRANFLSRFYVSFAVTLIPFYISNGILTGAFTPEPVVKYNDLYNLGIRTITIPVEDIFYGMALLVLNVAGFEYSRNTGSRQVNQQKSQSIN